MALSGASRPDQLVAPDEPIGREPQHRQPGLVPTEPRLARFAAGEPDRVLRSRRAGLESEVRRAAVPRVDLDEPDAIRAPERLDGDVTDEPDRRAQAERRVDQRRVVD